MSYTYRRGYNRYNDDFSTRLVAAALTAVLAIGGVFGLTWLTSESSADASRKAPLVTMMNNRARRCRIGDAADAELPQEQRLALVFEQTRSDALDTLIEKGITVCPDSRLAHQDTGFLDTTLRGVYHAADKVVTIYDNGSSVDKFWSDDITDRGDEMLEDIADELNSKNPSTENMYAGFYTRSCGKNCTTTYAEWNKAGGFFGFDSATLRKNPELLKPPVEGVATYGR